jgi:hypothetical protein
MLLLPTPPPHLHPHLGDLLFDRRYLPTWPARAPETTVGIEAGEAAVVAAASAASAALHAASSRCARATLLPQSRPHARPLRNRCKPCSPFLASPATPTPRPQRPPLTSYRSPHLRRRLSHMGLPPGPRRLALLGRGGRRVAAWVPQAPKPDEGGRSVVPGGAQGTGGGVWKARGAARRRAAARRCRRARPSPTPDGPFRAGSGRWCPGVTTASQTAPEVRGFASQCAQPLHRPQVGPGGLVAVCSERPPATPSGPAGPPRWLAPGRSQSRACGWSVACTV